MLKKLRIALAAFFFIGITLLLTGLLPGWEKWLGWMPKMQFLPAALALNAGVLILLVLLTLVFGRIYCSVICPLGVFQDIVSWISSKRKGKKMRFHFRPEQKWIRYGVLVLTLVALLAGVQVIVAALAPYSAYGRMVQSVFGPVRGLPVVIMAAVTFVAVTVLAWLYGRSWCNVICPVGTTLSFLSRFSLLRPVIDTDKCKDCHACERQCKANCIDISRHHIDYSRCVDCFNCLENCKFGALKYQLAYGKGRPSGAADSSAAPQNDKATAPQNDKARRAFLSSTAILAGSLALKAQEKAAKAVEEVTDDKKRDGGLAEILPKVAPERSIPLTPFGSRSVKDFYKHCTACQLCVATCPNNVLRPSTDLSRLMQPEMSYENGYCRPECTKCAQVCPAGAILPITPEEKTAIHIGVASVDLDLCVVNRDGVSCGNCARHCPAGAIIMVRIDPKDKDSLRIPTVNESRCIGCGACENLCPSRPLSAIRVNGLSVHIDESVNA